MTIFRSGTPPLAIGVLLFSVFGCAADTSEIDLGRSESLLTKSERRDRARLVRDAAAAHGLTNGFLLAGIADVETAMSHCWSELTWACKGPNSPSCGGGPVAAGAWDGECWEEKGGLGMFQFDAGRFDDTLAAYGKDVLTIEGNVRHAVDYVVAMISSRSNYLPDMSKEDALAWLNRLRPWHPEYELWAKTVTRHYNGCRETSSCWSARLPKYRNGGTKLFDEMGAEFWYGPGETCPFLPAEGGVVDDGGSCFAAAGSRAAWSGGAGGQEGGHAQLAANADASGVWTIKVSEASQYKIEALLPGGGSAGVDYEIVHSNGSSSVTVAQVAEGEQVLGSYFFEGGKSYSVRVNSVTVDGQPAMADALRITRVDTPIETNSSTASNESSGSTASMPSAAPSSPSAVATPAGLQGSCRVSKDASTQFPLALLSLLGCLVARSRPSHALR